MGIAYIGTAAVCDLNLSTSDKGLLSSMTFIGEIRLFSSHASELLVLCKDNAVCTKLVESFRKHNSAHAVNLIMGVI